MLLLPGLHRNPQPLPVISPRIRGWVLWRVGPRLGSTLSTFYVIIDVPVKKNVPVKKKRPKFNRGSKCTP